MNTTVFALTVETVMACRCGDGACARKTAEPVCLLGSLPLSHLIL